MNTINHNTVCGRRGWLWAWTTRPLLLTWWDVWRSTYSTSLTWAKHISVWEAEAVGLWRMTRAKSPRNHFTSVYSKFIMWMVSYTALLLSTDSCFISAAVSWSNRMLLVLVAHSFVAVSIALWTIPEVLRIGDPKNDSVINLDVVDLINLCNNFSGWRCNPLS